MPRFRVKYTIWQGPSHHDWDYMNPDAPLIPSKRESVIEAPDEKTARENFQKGNFGTPIDSIEIT